MRRIGWSARLQQGGVSDLVDAGHQVGEIAEVPHDRVAVEQPV